MSSFEYCLRGLSFNYFLACGDFCHLLITFVNSLDPDQDGSKPFDTSKVFLNVFLKKELILKIVSRRQQKHENFTQHAKS